MTPASAAELTPSDWQRVFALLDDALDLAPDDVPAWLAALDPSVGRYASELKRLLDDHATIERGTFMRTPAQFHAAVVAPVVGPRSDVEHDASRVGAYRLIDKIGRGGTATVWLAERADGLFARKVALKRPDVNFHGPGHGERLARERDILASLAHPNIARIYDAGVEADGRPYLAMEYVDGEPIDVFARTHALSIEQRVALLVEVARAVAHAHSQLVVHRDLKPSNILVDAHGRSHLVDFGIAKLLDATSPTLDDDAAGMDQTIAPGRSLTPHYASPEQLRGDPIGIASDVYSLGVVAFELLTGARPYRLAGDLGPSALAESVARCHVPRASAVVDDRTLRRALRGDLDAILGRMLEKRAGDRYPTIDAVADDLDRHLRHEPVSARGSARLYLARSWLRRHLLETAVAVAIVVATIGGAYVQLAVGLALGGGALVALWQRNEARQQAERARVALERGDRVKNFIVSILTQAAPGAGRDGGVKATDLLKVAARRLEADLVDQPAVAAELAAVIGDGFNELGDLSAGRDWLPKAIELCDREFGARHPWTLRARRRLVEAANTVGDLQTSAALLPALLRDLREARPPLPALLVQSLQSQAYILTKRDREAEAFAALDEAVTVAATHFGDDDRITLTARASLSNTCMHFGRPREALLAIEPALGPAYAAFGDERPHLVLTMVERNYADALTQNQRPRDATAILRQTVADQIALDGPDAPRLCFALQMLARALLFRGCTHEPLALMTRAVALNESMGAAISDNAVSLVGWLALAETEAGAPEAALARLAALDAASRAAGLARQGAAEVVRALAQLRSGDGDEAIATLDAAAPVIARESATTRMRAQRVRVSALRRRGDATDALAMARAAIDGVDPQVAAIEHGWLAIEAARASAALADPAGAAVFWRRGLAIWEDGQVDGRDLHDALRDEIHAALGTNPER